MWPTGSMGMMRGVLTKKSSRQRVPLFVLAVLACGAQVSCGSGARTSTTADGTCGRAPKAGPAQTPRADPSGAAGSETDSRHYAPPPRATPSVPPPTPVDGRLALTAADSGQTISVPAGTLIEIDLTPVSGAVWTVPESSDPKALPRLSASGACETVKVATFRAVADGAISASGPRGDAEARLTITLHVI